MARCRVDQSITRVEKAGFVFPLGVYPVEELTPKPGFTTAFEAADGDSSDAIGGGSGGFSGSAGGGGSGGTGGFGGRGGDDDEGSTPKPGGVGGEWEEWPDRYVFDILVPATRIEPLCRALFTLLPGRVYPILDFLGQDEWREVDPYVSYELIGMDRFLDALRRFRGFFYEDGLVGFGAMSEEPFVYVFVDEHKVVTVRAQSDMKEKVEQVLAAFDLEQVEELTSADSVTHEHRAVLDAPDDRRDLLNAEEIVELLREDWRMVLNIDPDSNLDEEGNDLGITGWRCILRYDPPAPAATDGEKEEKKNGAEKKGSGKGAKSADKPAKKKDDVEPDQAEGEEGATAEGSESAAAGSAQPPLPPEPRYVQVFLTADSLNRATELALHGLEELLGKDPNPPADDELLPEPFLVQADRWGEQDFAREVESVTGQKPDMTGSAMCFSEWLQ